MAKQKQIDQPSQPKLKPEEYWEWRTTISEMDNAKQKYLYAQLEFKLMQKEMENMAIRLQLFQKIRLENSKNDWELAQKEYDRYKNILEERHKSSLSNKVIDDVTYEIRELPDQKNAHGMSGRE